MLETRLIGETSIPINLESGMYIVEIKSEDGILTEKLIVK